MFMIAVGKCQSKYRISISTPRTKWQVIPDYKDIDLDDELSRVNENRVIATMVIRPFDDHTYHILSPAVDLKKAVGL